MNLAEKLAGEIARVAGLREQYKALQGTPGVNVKPAILLMNVGLGHYLVVGISATNRLLGRLSRTWRDSPADGRFTMEEETMKKLVLILGLVAAGLLSVELALLVGREVRAQEPTPPALVEGKALDEVTALKIENARFKQDEVARQVQAKYQEWLRTPEIQALITKANVHGSEAQKLEAEAVKAAGLDPEKYTVDVERRGFVPKLPAR